MSLAFEKELLDKYRNYPNIFPYNNQIMKYNTSFNGDRNNLNNNSTTTTTTKLEKQLNQDNIQKKVMILNGNDLELENSEERNNERRRGCRCRREDDEDDDDDDRRRRRPKIKWWWEPSANSISREFCIDSSMHGLKYLSQPKRHLCERIFWLMFFLTGVGFATFLIGLELQQYANSPVIVSFLPSDVDIGLITFPAVTICNMNKLRTTVVENLNKSHLSSLEKGQALLKLSEARSLCDSQRSFANYFDFAYNRGRINIEEASFDFLNATTEDDSFEKFVGDHTLRCDEIIRLCRWGGEVANCSDLFKDIITDYGKCCTFNTLPEHLMQKGINEENDEERNQTRLWKTWTESAEFLLPEYWTEENPKTQKRPGSPYGLSIALNVNTSEYFCPSSDSEGFQIILHAPSEMPQVRDFGAPIGLGNEIFMKVIPEVITAGDDIRSFNKLKRSCILRKEGNLDYYQHYTRTNCVNECITKAIINECNCSFYYMPSLAKDKTGICNPDPTKTDFNCSSKTRHNISETLKTNCVHCDSLCSDIIFRTETSFSKLQPNIWSDFGPRMKEQPEWTKNKVSILHIFYGDLYTVPKIRKALFGITDMIANVGGLLGLCLGFSMLSAVEIIYFFTCRAFMKRLRRKRTIKTSSSSTNQIRRMIYYGNDSTEEEFRRPSTLRRNSIQLPAFYNNPNIDAAFSY